MKKWAAMAAVVVMVFSGVSYVSAQSAPKPEKGVLVGTAVEISTYLMKGLDFEGFADTCKNRAELGFPVAIVEDETDKLYVLVYRNPAPASSLQTANKILGDLMGQKVVVQGLIYRSKHANLVRISVVSEY